MRSVATDRRDQPGSATTLDDVARAAGVSLATASRVLNGSTRKVADSYRARVEAAAERLGYTANLSAQATARGTSATVALLVADIADPYFGELAAGVARGADEAGLVMTIAITDRDPEREVRLLRALRGQRPRGVILAASRTTAASVPDLQHEVALLESAGGTLVTLGRGLVGTRTVAFDNHRAARTLAEALIAQGYEHAIVLAADSGVVTSDARVSGFAEGFEAGTGNRARLLRGGFSRESARESMSIVLDEGIAPRTVIFGISDLLAIGAMSAVRERGMTPGQDVAIAGFDDVAIARDVVPQLTTVHVPLEAMGYEALRAAIDPDWQPSMQGLEFEVLLRDSTPTLRR